MADTRVLIEGIGGIGGVMAARLVHAGYDPLLITGNREITATIRARGIRATTPEGDLAVPARALTSVEELDDHEPFDVALLVMKAGQVLEAAEKTLPHLATGSGYLVTLQNGIVEDAVSEVVGEERLVSGIVGWGGTFVGPGVYAKTGPGAIHIGELDGKLSDRIRGLATLIEAASPVVITENIRGVLWSKLGINCTITAMGALTGQTLGELLRERKVRDAFLALYREVYDTATSLGVRLERIAANPRLLYLSADAGPATRLAKDLIARFVGRKYKDLKSSSLQSLERGRPTEIDFLNGYVAQQAAKAGVPAPLNAAMTRLIKEIEAGQRKIAPANIEELLAASPSGGASYNRDQG